MSLGSENRWADHYSESPLGYGPLLLGLIINAHILQEQKGKTTAKCYHIPSPAGTCQPIKCCGTVGICSWCCSCHFAIERWTMVDLYNKSNIDTWTKVHTKDSWFYMILHRCLCDVYQVIQILIHPIPSLAVSFSKSFITTFFEKSGNKETCSRWHSQQTHGSNGFEPTWHWTGIG